MKTKISVVLLVFSLFLTATPFSFAQTTPTDWSAMRNLAAGTDLFIKTSKGKTVKGSLVVVNNDEVELSVKRSNRLLLKNNIEAVYFAVPKSGKRARLIGATIGALVAVAGYGAAAGDGGDSGTGAPVIPFFAGGIGGGFIGGLFGKGRKKGALIYKAR